MNLIQKLLLALASLAKGRRRHGEVSAAELERLYARDSVFAATPESAWLMQSPRAFVIRDKYPQAPVHLLVIPKEKIPSVLQAEADLLGEMLELAKRAAAMEGLTQDGFRLVINTHPFGGQTIYHLHIHVLGGRVMGWPPG